MSAMEAVASNRSGWRQGHRWRSAAPGGIVRLTLPYLAALVAVACCTALIAALRLRLPHAHLAILYLLPVLALASVGGRGPALATALLSSLAYDFAFVEPVFTPTIRDPDEWLTLIVFLVTALVAGQLAASLRLRMEEARDRAATGALLLGQLAYTQQARAALTATLYELTQTLIADQPPEQLLALIAEQVVTTFGVRDCAILLPSPDGTLHVRASYPPGILLPEQELDGEATRYWAAPHAAATPPENNAVLFVLLQAGTRQVGLMRVTRPTHDALDGERHHLLSTFAAGAALAIERGLLAEATMRAAVLARSDALKSTLLASVSHELRTPLAAIKGSVSSLLEEGEQVRWDDSSRHDFLLTIDEETDRLTRLVGNLLDLSRIEAGVLRPHREPFGLDELLWGVVDRLPASVAARIRLHVPADLPLVPLDPVLMERVVSNLLENAVKYAPPDTPITITAEECADGVRLGVADQGPGVPASERERIFERFYRAEQARAAKGVGLGLALSRALVEAHGGRLGVEDTPGGGARFVATLPLTVAPTPDAPDECKQPGQ